MYVWVFISFCFRSVALTLVLSLVDNNSNNSSSNNVSQAPLKGRPRCQVRPVRQEVIEVSYSGIQNPESGCIFDLLTDLIFSRRQPL